MNNKKVKTNDDFLSICGLDVPHGIAMTGGKESGYIAVLSMFCKDAENRLPLLQTQPSPDSLTSFVIQVHALKSASYSIGAAKLSALAEDLLSAGKTRDFEVIQDKLPTFAEQLIELVNNIKSALKGSREQGSNEQ